MPNGNPLTARSSMHLSSQGGIEMVCQKNSVAIMPQPSRQASQAHSMKPLAKALVGTKLPGKIARIRCDPYEYTIKETGEVITLTHRWAYNPNEAAVDEMVYEKSQSREQSLLSDQRKGGESLLFFCVLT